MNTTLLNIIRQALRESSWLTYFIVFWVAAVLSLFSCSLIRIPVVIGYVGSVATSRKRTILFTLSFALATIISYTILGVLFGLIGDLMHKMVGLSKYFYFFIGVLALFVGLNMAGLLEFKLSDKRELKPPDLKKWGALGAFAFGVVFAIFEAPTCPCCGPALFIISGYVFTKGSIFKAIFIFLAYALGQSFPLILLGSFTGIIKYGNPNFKKIETIAKVIGGNILIVMGFYFLLLG